MTRTAALRIFRAARKRYATAAYGDKRRSLDALIKARTALMAVENARNVKAARGGAR